MLRGWLLVLASGACATSLLRVAIAGMGSAALAVHMGAGALVGMLILWRLRSRPWETSAVAATLAFGLGASVWFAPAVVAIHAAMAALTAAALATGWRADGLRLAAHGSATWKYKVTATGFVLLAVQVLLGALLRHGLVNLSSHLLMAGLAALCILAPAVAVAYDDRSSPVEKHAAARAVTSLLVQAGLGVAMLIMMMTGAVTAVVWLLATVAHVVVGTMTLISAGKLARVLHTPLEDGGS